MSEQDKQEAKELGARAARQSQQAAKNTARAARAAMPVAAEKIGDAAEVVNDVVEDVTDAAVRETRKVSPRILSRLTGDTGIGFLALSVSIYAGTIAFNQFRGVYSQRGQVMRAPNKQVRYRRTGDAT
jgi:hypothetical protein